MATPNDNIFARLPKELQHTISDQLSHQDAVRLAQASRYFYALMHRCDAPFADKSGLGDSAQPEDPHDSAPRQKRNFGAKHFHEDRLQYIQDKFGCSAYQLIPIGYRPKTLSQETVMFVVHLAQEV